ncbi:MAG: hypothetical protein AAGG51_01645 [Cyanobacteria bacterium P01_G01_bin.54]
MGANVAPLRTFKIHAIRRGAIASAHTPPWFPHTHWAQALRPYADSKFMPSAGARSHPPTPHHGSRIPIGRKRCAPTPIQNSRHP